MDIADSCFTDRFALLLIEFLGVGGGCEFMKGRLTLFPDGSLLPPLTQLAFVLFLLLAGKPNLFQITFNSTPLLVMKSVFNSAPLLAFTLHL